MRTEKDLLGKREIPDDAYYGVHTLRATENFKISKKKVGDVPELIFAVAKVKKATARANFELGSLSEEKYNAIAKACDILVEKAKTDKEFCRKQFPVDLFQGGAGTSFNMNANEVIANLALEQIGEPKGSYKIINPNDDINHGQSTNDTYPTSIRLAFYLGLEDLIIELQEIIVALNKKRDEFNDVFKLGRTQLQDAVPMRVGQEFGAFANLLTEEISHINRQRQPLLEHNLGATAIGTGVTAEKGYTKLANDFLAEFTGLETQSATDLIEATSDSGAFVTAHCGPKRLAVKLSKICNDLRLLSSGPRAGLNEINLPEVQAGSSIMPGKVNPVIPEVVNQICFKVIGNDLTVAMAAEAPQLQLNYAEPVIVECFFSSIEILSNALKTLRKNCIEGITVNKEICEGYAYNSIGIVTYLDNYLGHEVCDEIAKEAKETGKQVREIVLEKGYLDAKTLDEALDFTKLI
jgi:aspartate ammonia-lyase